ncbi:FmdB family zinc ribbon protein [Nocardiopsis coralliicola]
MPTYQYVCTECSTPLEVVQSFSDDSLTECPSCEGRLRKVYSAVGIVFKGSGFYRTDSAKTSDRSAVTGSSGKDGGDSGGDSGSAGSSADSGSSSSSESSGTSSSSDSGSSSNGSSSNGSSNGASSGSSSSSPSPSSPKAAAKA